MESKIHQLSLDSAHFGWHWHKSYVQ